MKQLNLYWLGGGGSSVPDGNTVTPINDVTLLQQCAGIANAPYTTLSEIFSDSGILRTIINSNNAINYLVRSTSFAKVQALVPTMTDNTHPSGICTADASYGSYQPYVVFDRDSSTIWLGNGSTNKSVTYQFPEVQTVKRLALQTLVDTANVRIKNFKVQGSNDGSTYTDIGSFVYANNHDLQYFDLNNETSYLYYRLLVVDSYDSSLMIGIATIQYYSNTIAEGFVDNATAMSYIGLNNYASNTLLADSTWRSAICNSTYFESVLNVKVPIMTSNTTPRGTCISDLNENDIWKAFDGDISTGYSPTYMAATATEFYTGYIFTSSAKFYRADCDFQPQSTYYSPKISEVYLDAYINDSWTREDTYTNIVDNANNSRTSIFNGIETDRLRLSGTRAYYSANKYWGIVTRKLQFYGRKDV